MSNGDAVRDLKVSPVFADFLDQILTIDAVDVQGVKADLIVDSGEIAVEVSQLIDDAGRLQTVDANLTEDEKAFAWTLVWALVHKTGILQVPASEALDTKRLSIRDASKPLPIQEFISTEYTARLFRTFYAAVCLLLYRK